MSRYGFVVTSLSLSLLMVFCYFFIDRQVVDFLSAHNSRQFRVFHYFAEIPPLVAGLVVAGVFLVTLLRFLLARPLSTRWLDIAICCVSAIWLKDVLKRLFGRYFPDQWFCSNTSYLTDGVYGFGGLGYPFGNASFPSGHITLIATFALVTLYWFPRWRWLLFGAVVIALIGQIVSYYHYVSDLIAALLLASCVFSVYIAYRADTFNRP